MEKIYVVSLGEEFEKSRTPGAKDIEPRKRKAMQENKLWKRVGFSHAPVSIEGQIIALKEARNKLNPESHPNLISEINVLMDKLSRVIKR